MYGVCVASVISGLNVVGSHQLGEHLKTGPHHQGGSSHDPCQVRIGERWSLVGQQQMRMKMVTGGELDLAINVSITSHFYTYSRTWSQSHASHRGVYSGKYRELISRICISIAICLPGWFLLNIKLFILIPFYFLEQTFWFGGHGKCMDFYLHQYWDLFTRE